MKQKITHNTFIDRINELAMLTHGLKHGKDFVLIAPRRFGKTTLVNQVFNKIREDKEYILINIDVMRYSGSIRKIAEGITEQCLNALGYKGKLQLLMKQVNLSLQLKISLGDLEIEPIINLLQDKSNDTLLLGHALELFEKVALKTNKNLIIFFDEFGELHSLGDEVIKIFRSVLQTQKHACCIFAGSQETLMSKIFVDRTSAFFRFGDIINLKALDQKEVVEYLNQLNFDAAVSLNIISLLECHPYYTSKAIKDLILEPIYASSSSEFYRYIAERLFTQESSYLEMLIQKIKYRAHALEILTNIATGSNPNLGLENISKQSIYNIIKILLENGYITKIESQYKLTDPLLKLYLSQ